MSGTDEIWEIPYMFSHDELKQLAWFFRKNRGSMPVVLENLSDFAENYIYSKLTIGEAERFFEN